MIGNTTFTLLFGLNYRPTVAAVVAIGVVAIGGVQIWLRGYLIPGTPTLSARYFPPWLLRGFGKEPFAVDGTRSGSGVDTERHLRAANAVRFDGRTARGTLEDAFADEWQAAIDELAGVETTVGDVFGVDGEVRIDERADHVRMTLAGRPFGRWVSEAALLADLGGGRVLAARSDTWADLSTTERGRVLAELRRYIEVCPACAGETVESVDSVTSCCSEYEVVTVSCSDCGTRLSEVPAEAVDDPEPSS